MGRLEPMELPRFEDLARSADAHAGPAGARAGDRVRSSRTRHARSRRSTNWAKRSPAPCEGSARTPHAETLALSHVLGTLHGFTGDTEQYDRPENSMLDRVLERRRGLPILLSTVYVEAARRARHARSPASGCPATTSSRISVRRSRCCSIRSAAARPSRPTPPPRSSGRGPHTRPRCGCSTTSCRRSGVAAISPALCAPPNCDSRFPPTPTSEPASTPNSPRFEHFVTSAVASLIPPPGRRGACTGARIRFASGQFCVSRREQRGKASKFHDASRAPITPFWVDRSVI